MKITRRLPGPILLALLITTAGCADKESKYKKTTVKRGDVVEKVSVRGNFDSLTDANVANLQPSSLVVEILVNEGDLVKKGDVMAKLSSRDRENLINTATAALEKLQKQNSESGGADEALKRQIEQAERELVFAREEYQIVPVLSPVDGLVSARRVEEGESVHTNQTMFVLRDRLIVTCDVNESDIAKVSIGQSVEVVPDAYPTKKYYADVYAIGSYGKGRSEVINFEVKSQLQEIDDTLKLGMSADVDIIIEKAEGVLYLPVEFVQFEPANDKKDEEEEAAEDKKPRKKERKRGGRRNREYDPGKRNFSKAPEWEKKKGTTFVLTGDEEDPRKVKVKTGFSNNIMVEIKKGLKEGTAVLLEKKERKKDSWN